MSNKMSDDLSDIKEFVTFSNGDKVHTEELILYLKQLSVTCMKNVDFSEWTMVRLEFYRNYLSQEEIKKLIQWSLKNLNSDEIKILSGFNEISHRKDKRGSKPTKKASNSIFVFCKNVNDCLILKLHGLAEILK